MATPEEARDWDRWRGGADQWREGADSRFRRVDRKAEEMDKRQDEFDRELTRVTTKIAVAAGIGAVGGGALVTLILTIATKALGG